MHSVIRSAVESKHDRSEFKEAEVAQSRGDIGLSFASQMIKSFFEKTKTRSIRVVPGNPLPKSNERALTILTASISHDDLKLYREKELCLKNSFT